MARLGRPSPEDWVARYKQADKFQRNWRSIAHMTSGLYEMRWNLDGIPDNVPITLPSTARAIIDEATDHSDFDPHFLQLRVPTYGLTTDAEKLAGDIRSFFHGWLVEQAERYNDVSPYRDFIKNLYLYGKAVLKTVWDKSEWPLLEIPEGTTEDDARKMRERVARDREWVIPIITRSIDPLAIFEDPSVGQKRWAIEEYEFEAQEILPLYEFWLKPAELLNDDGEIPPETKLKLWDCYQIGREGDEDGIWHQMLIGASDAVESGVIGTFSPADSRDGQFEPVFLAGEPFPYSIRFSGLGRQSTGKYEEKARGILFGAHSLLRAEARRLTQLDAIVAIYAWPTLFVTGSRARFNVVWGPREVNYVPPGTEVSTISPQIPTGALQAALGTIQAGIERATFGSVIRGDKPPNTTSAAQLAILSGQARLRFGAINVGTAAALHDAVQKAVQIAKVIGEDLTILQWEDTDTEEPSKLVLDPSTLPDTLPLRVEILTDPAEEQDRRIQLASFLFRDGVIDIEEYRERAGIRDVAAMRRRTIRDKVLFEGEGLIQALGQSFLLESGYDIESLILEKTMLDLLILRRRSEMQEQVLGPPQAQGNEPRAQDIAPSPLGGNPGQGPQVPTAGVAGQAAQQGAI